MELSNEKSQQQAEILQSIAVDVFLLDTEYCREVAEAMHDQASRQESMAVLNPSYPLEKNDLIRKKADALIHLCDYVDALKQVRDIEKEVGEKEKVQDQINKMFL